MPTQSIRTVVIPSSARAETWRDLIIVSAFGLWALLLGFMPVVALRALIG